MPSMSPKTIAIAAALFGIIAVATAAPADAKPRACTNSEIRNVVSDYLIIACANRGGSVKCDGGTAVCCKNNVCVDAGNINHLSNDPGPPRPPRGVRTDPGPDRVSPPQNPTRPPRASTPPSRIGPPASSGPKVK